LTVVGVLAFLSANGVHINIGQQELFAISNRGLSMLYYTVSVVVIHHLI